MSFDLFGPAKQEDIRVGYISTERGFVSDVTICEANDYAKLNPGTRFIFRTRDNVNFLNINQVNALTPNDLEPQSSKNCDGVQLETECGPPQALFYGGGGVGVKGNPVIGEDGSVLAVDLVSGGFGYQYAPIVEVKDGCGIGAGAVTRAVLGEIVDTVEYYDQEDDFEEYQICDPNEVGYGKRYSPDGKELGNWDPTLYANLSEDPIRREIQQYQDFLQNLSKPWWTTRKFTPLSVTSGNRSNRVKFDVTDKTHLDLVRSETGNQNYVAWNGFMNSYAISPVPPSNVLGSDFATDLFTIEWEENFPYDGEYIFRGLADGEVKDLYLDNIKISTLKSFNQSPEVIKKTIKSGVHRIRVDLKNGGETKKTILTQENSGLIDVQFDVYGQGKRTSELKFSFAATDGTHSFVIRGVDENKGTRKDTIKVKPNIEYKVVASTPRNNGLIEQGTIKNKKKNKEGGLESSNTIFADFIESANDNDDMQITCGAGIFTPTKKGKTDAGRSTYDLTFKVEGTPNTNSNQSITSGNQTKKVFNTVDYINKADRQLWRINPNAGKDADFINQYGILPFDPATSAATSDDFSGTHVIRWEYVEFPADGNYNIEVMVDDNVTLYIGNRVGGGAKEIGNGLRSINEGGDEVIITKRGFSGPGKSTGKTLETRFFKAGKYRIRAELEQIKGKPLSKGNPMALAINIEASFTVKEIVSSRSWNQNPMGVSLTIDAPMPPVPQEPIPQQEGRCPRNPIWSTRFPGAKENWYPVILDNRWSKFMNRYALSPVPPNNGIKSMIGFDYSPGTADAEGRGGDQYFGYGVDYPNAKSQGFTDADIRYYLENDFKGLIGPDMKKVLLDPNWGKIPEFDSGGIIYRNLWDIDIPYDGFYGLRGTVDNGGRILIDGKEIISGGGASFRGRSVGTKGLDGFKIENPQTTKVFLTKGMHEIEVEVENQKIETSVAIDKKIFSTNDWLLQSTTNEVSTTDTSNIKAKFVREGNNLYLKIEGNGTAEISFVMDVNDNPAVAGLAAKEVVIPSDSGKLRFVRNSDLRKDETIKNKGTFSAGKTYGPIQIIGAASGAGAPKVSNNKIGLLDADGTDENIKIIISNVKAGNTSTQKTTSSGGLLSGTAKDGVGYDGPPLANYIGRFISPRIDNTTSPTDEIQGKTWVMKWSNVDFPEDGQYTIRAEADDEVIIRIDGAEAGRAKVFQGVKTFFFNTTKGKRTIELELSNISIPDTGFRENPVVAFVEITKKVNVLTTLNASWVENPVGISAILIPPPCPRVVRGKGVIVDVEVDDPGNGYPRPQGNLSPQVSSVYPAALRLKSVAVEDSGINYNCGIDQIQITPDNGAVLEYECDTFGRITNVKVVNPGLGFTRYPEISILSDTGVNATFRPQFEVVRDPIVIDPNKLIQVTDLVGLKQTGYVDGRAYYGAVFYKDGVRYAGFYETIGDLVQVYDTLQESIDAQVTTPPSAILRQGTDIRSNDPRLNIPGSPENIS